MRSLLAVVILLTAVPAAAGEPLEIRVAYSPELRRRPGWTAELDCAVSRASAAIHQAIGRELVVTSRVPWLGAKVGRSVRDLREALVEDVELGDADVIMGLSVHVGLSPRAPRPIGVEIEPQLDMSLDEGLAHYTRGYVVFSVRANDLCETYRLVAHELAHVYGGVHRDGEEYLMDQDGTGLEIDPLNAELLALHRGRLFGPGRAPLSGEDLRRMWRLARADLEDPETWLVVGFLAARMGKPVDAARNYEKALAIDADHAQALVNLGHARFQLGELDAAEASYVKALAVRGDDGEVSNNLAAIYYARNLPEEALPHLRKALELGFAVHPLFIEEIEKATGKRLKASAHR